MRFFDKTEDFLSGKQVSIKIIIGFWYTIQKLTYFVLKDKEILLFYIYLFLCFLNNVEFKININTFTKKDMVIGQE